MKTTQVQNKKDLLYLLNLNKDSLQNFGVKRLGLFGSFVRDQATDESDIDFLIELPKERKTMRNLSDLYDFLSSVTGRNIELVTPQSLSPYIGPKILKEVEYVFG